jgi:hypothetical protein
MALPCSGIRERTRHGFDVCAGKDRSSVVPRTWNERVADWQPRHPGLGDYEICLLAARPLSAFWFL